MPKNITTLSLPVDLATASQEATEARPATESNTSAGKRFDTQKKGKRKRTKHPPHVSRRFNPSSRFRG